MKFYDSLFMDEKLLQKKEAIIKKLKNNQWQFEIYLIVLSKNENNHLELFHSVLLQQKAISKDDLFVVGIASGYQEALELVEKITQQVYDKTNEVDIRNYILTNQNEYEKGNV